MDENCTSLASDALDALEASLPPVIARSDVRKFLGNIVSPGHLANCDSRGDGPAGMFYLGRRACYTRTALLKWLRDRVHHDKGRVAGGKK